MKAPKSSGLPTRLALVHSLIQPVPIVMFKPLLLAAALMPLVSSSLQAQSSNLDREHRVVMYRNAPIQALYDARSQSPVWVYNPESLPARSGGIFSRRSAQNRADAFFREHRAFFGLNSIALAEPVIHADEKHWFISFQQSYRGIPVLQSEAGLTYTRAGELVAAGARIFPNINLNPTPTLSATSAESKAIGKVKGKASSTQKPALFIFPEPDERQYRYRLVWAIALETTAPVREASTHLVDAHSGAYIMAVGPIGARNLEEEAFTEPEYAPSAASTSIEGHIKLNYTTSPGNATSSLIKHYDKPFRYAKVVLTKGVTTTVTYADANGFYKFAGLSPGTTYTVTFELANNKAFVQTGLSTGKKSKSFTVTTSTGTNRRDYDWGWGDDGDHNASLTAIALNGVYHIREMYSYYKNRIGYAGMDNYGLIKLRVFQGTGSAYTGWPSFHHITLVGSYGRSDDVIKHEYAHIVIQKLNNKLLSSTSGRSMHEGLADFFACGQTNDYTFGGPSGTATIRYCHNTFTMDDYVNSGSKIHNNGRILSGGLWFTRISYKAAGNLSDKDAEKLAYRALQASPKATSYEDFYDRMLWADKAYFGGKGKYYLEDRFIFRKFGWPLPPVLTSIGTYGQGTELKWQDVSKKESGYRVYRAFNQSSYEPVATLGPNKTLYWDQVNCQSTTGTWWYKIEAYATVGGSVGETAGDSGGYDTQTPCNKTFVQQPAPLTASSQLPVSTTLFGAYPNPFNPRTQVRYALHTPSDIHVAIYDVQGRQVAVLLNEFQDAGTYSIDFDAEGLPSGVYLTRLTTQYQTQTRLMTLIK